MPRVPPSMRLSMNGAQKKANAVVVGISNGQCLLAAMGVYSSVVSSHSSSINRLAPPVMREKLRALFASALLIYKGANERGNM
jgi:hypothetical protein